MDDVHFLVSHTKFTNDPGRTGFPGRKKIYRNQNYTAGFSESTPFNVSSPVDCTNTPPKIIAKPQTQETTRILLFSAFRLRSRFFVVVIHNHWYCAIIFFSIFSKFFENSRLVNVDFKVFQDRFSDLKWISSWWKMMVRPYLLRTITSRRTR